MHLATLLHARPLDPRTFAPFGHVVEAGSAGRWINDGNAWRSEAGPLALGASGGAPALAVFHARGRDPRGPWQLLERHRLGSQSFLPMGLARCVLLVACGTDMPDPTTVAAFVTRPGQGWTLAPGVWHHALIVMTDVDVAVLERRAEAEDCELAHLLTPVEIQLP